MLLGLQPFFEQHNRGKHLGEGQFILVITSRDIVLQITYLRVNNTSSHNIVDNPVVKRRNSHRLGDLLHVSNVVKLVIS